MNETTRITLHYLEQITRAAAEIHDRNARRLVPYRLPDGRIVQVDASAAKDARVISFELAAEPGQRRGRIVDAIQVRVEELQPVPAWMPAAAREVGDQLRAFADRYPDRFEFINGKLKQKRSSR